MLGTLSRLLFLCPSLKSPIPGLSIILPSFSPSFQILSFHLHGNLLILLHLFSLILQSLPSGHAVSVPRWALPAFGNTSLWHWRCPHTLLASTSSSQLPCLLSHCSFSILFLLCRFQFLKVSPRWMANGALLSGREEKKGGETHKEDEWWWRERDREGKDGKDFPLDNKVFRFLYAILDWLRAKLTAHISRTSSSFLTSHQWDKADHSAGNYINTTKADALNRWEVVNRSYYCLN